MGKKKKKKWNGLRDSLDPNNISASPHITEEENLKFHLIPLKSIKEIRKSDLRLGKRRSFFDKIAWEEKKQTNKLALVHPLG